MVRLNPLPDGVEFLVTAQTGLDVVLFFTRTAGELLSRLPALARSITLPGASGSPGSEGGTALDEDIVRQAGLDLGWWTTSAAELGDRLGRRSGSSARPAPAPPAPEAGSPPSPTPEPDERDTPWNRRVRRILAPAPCFCKYQD